MDAKELLKGWPGWANANAARVLASPAWRLEVRYDGKPAVLTRRETPPDEGAISLVVKFNDVPRTVTFAPSPLFPDLWVLRERLGGLPAEILLALVEKECGALFQFFEDVSRQSFSVSGLSEKPSVGTAFALAAEGGEVSFSVDLSATTEQSLGQLANLDETHEAIRSLTRDVTASYAAFEMSDDEVAALAAGDCLVLPEDAAATWEVEVPSDGAVRLVAPETRTVTFGELADETLGPVPPAERVRLVRRGQEIATGVFAKLGDAQVVRIEAVIPGA